MRIKMFVTTLLTVLLLTSAFVGTALAVTYYDVAGEFMCTCGCNNVLKNCENMQCSTKEEMKKVIGGMIKDGKTKDEIVANVRVKYSDKILSAPPREGFNLVAYIAPYVLVMAGLLMVSLVVRTWVARQQERYALVGAGSDEAAAAAKPISKKDADKLSKELDDFGGF